MVSCAHVSSACCCFDTLRPSTLHSSPSLSSSFPFSCSSSSSSMFVGSMRSPHACFREWGVGHFGREQSSHRLWAQLHRQLPHVRDHWHIHPGVFQRQQARKSAWLGVRWLHHRQSALFTPVSGVEKIQRAVDKFITLLTKACCQVSRRLSVMLEQGDVFSMSLDH